MRDFAKPLVASLGLAILRVNVSYSTQARAAITAGKAVVHANHVSLLIGLIGAPFSRAQT
jgi:hypothetical protein